ncbi:GNAT family N-acetyltransferase [Leptolyngbya sp. FACHB-261]|uniref:GNAT family N-acetyltransferase n=1 Tax=Leptolyngbya sp. FACHB-261 TaxID=2692806 RepID=UPI0016834F83|nr:GNAT family N-acetyltransferase [Leptolyngbya sp. FACHB-261]MBD2102330.1 GNAT family N-acetyltransferase [Leptolyngbya sp. FACHB-261]
MRIKEVEYDSDEWAAARRIRYSLFYEPVGLPESVLDDSIERVAFRIVLVDGSVVGGCGRLSINDESEGIISQMAVLPKYQGTGAGRTIMLALLDKAKSLGISSLRLSGRLTARGFYEKFGFVAIGASFPSKTTGVEHIEMILRRA